MTQDARISVGLPGHPKTKRIIKRLGEGGAWHLVKLFLWVAANRADGELAGLSDEDLELSVDWSGRAGEFVDALEQVGFLDGPAKERRVHDWAEHNPWAAGSESRRDKSRYAAYAKHHGASEAARRMPDYATRIGAIATGIPDPATGIGSADSGSAPLPLPLPSPKQEKGAVEPRPLSDDEPRGNSITFGVFVDQCRAAGELAIPEAHPVFKFGEDAGIPTEWIHLAWREFRRNYGRGGKQSRNRQNGRKGWRQHFHNAVRGGWYKLWFFDAQGKCALTTAGVQVAREAEADARRLTENEAST